MKKNIKIKKIIFNLVNDKKLVFNNLKIVEPEDLNNNCIVFSQYDIFIKNNKGVIISIVRGNVLFYEQILEK